MEEIRELEVHRFDGAFYAETKRYLEKRGCEWFTTRGRHGELQTIKIIFPPGTKYKRVLEVGEWVNNEIYLTNGMMYWSINSGLNGISVPYTYL